MYHNKRQLVLNILDVCLKILAYGSLDSMDHLTALSFSQKVFTAHNKTIWNRTNTDLFAHFVLYKLQEYCYVHLWLMHFLTHLMQTNYII